MCRADIAPLAADPLAALLVAIAERLAAAEGVDPGEVRIGPVDFGDEPERDYAAAGAIDSPTAGTPRIWSARYI